jgi:hypothetical protein
MLFFAAGRHIRRLFFLSGAILLAATVAPAQYQYSGETFIGYSHLSFKPETQIDSTGLNGFEGSLAGYVNEWFSLAGSVSHYHGSTALTPPLDGTSNVDLQLWNYMMGPQVRVVREERFSGMVRVLFGMTQGDADPDTFQVNGNPLRLSIKESKFAMSIGGGFDVNITEQLAWRVIQPEYLMTSFSGGRQGNFRFATGLIYRFSERKISP